MHRYFPGGRVMSGVLWKVKVLSLLKKTVTLVSLTMSKAGVDWAHDWWGALALRYGKRQRERTSIVFSAGYKNWEGPEDLQPKKTVAANKNSAAHLLVIVFCWSCEWSTLNTIMCALKCQVKVVYFSSVSGKYKIREQLGQFLCEFALAINSLTNWGNKTVWQPLQLLSWMAQIGVEIPLSWQRS